MTTAPSTKSTENRSIEQLQKELEAAKGPQNKNRRKTLRKKIAKIQNVQRAVSQGGNDKPVTEKKPGEQQDTAAANIKSDDQSVPQAEKQASGHLPKTLSEGELPPAFGEGLRQIKSEKEMQRQREMARKQSELNAKVRAAKLAREEEQRKQEARKAEARAAEAAFLAKGKKKKKKKKRTEPKNKETNEVHETKKSKDGSAGAVEDNSVGAKMATKSAGASAVASVAAAAQAETPAEPTKAAAKPAKAAAAVGESTTTSVTTEMPPTLAVSDMPDPGIPDMQNIARGRRPAATQHLEDSTACCSMLGCTVM
jgi:hypothetical protein